MLTQSGSALNLSIWRPRLTWGGFHNGSVCECACVWVCHNGFQSQITGFWLVWRRDTDWNVWFRWDLLTMQKWGANRTSQLSYRCLNESVVMHGWNHTGSNFLHCKLWIQRIHQSIHLGPDHICCPSLWQPVQQSSQNWQVRQAA